MRGALVDPKRIAEILADLANASETDVRAALAALQAQATELASNAPSAENITALKAVLASKVALNTELTSRSAMGTLAAEQAAVLADLDGTHNPERDAVPHPGTEAAPVVEAVEPAAEAPVDGADGAAKAEGDKAPAKKTAPKARQASALGQLAANTSPDAANAQLVSGTTRVRGGVPGMEFGQVLTDELFAKAFAEKANSSGGVGRMDVARIDFAYPEERRLGMDPSANQLKLHAVKSPEAITAAGGLCLPLEVRYDIKVLGVTDRPVRDALARYAVERGGIQYRLPFDALSMTTGLGVWTQAMDSAIVQPPPDPDTNVYKTCMEVSCPGVVEASIYSTYLCLEFANMTSRFDPEWVQATTEASMIAWARFAENNLLTQMFAGSKILYGLGGKVSAIADLLATYDRVISYYRYRHRLNSSVNLRTIMPQWVIDMLRTDLARRMTLASPGELFAIAQTMIESFFATRGVNVTWHLDGLPAPGGAISGITVPSQQYADTSAGQAVPNWPTKIDSLLFVEGDWLYLDGGTLDLGLVRDSALNLRNRYQTFVETFEGVAFDGKESLRIVIPLVPTGSAAGSTAVPAGPGYWDAITPA
jgi:hypothetical protein